jgi:DNA-binding HxlR family transcriptional regulator
MAATLKWEEIFNLSDIKTLYYLSSNGESRYSDLLRGVRVTRGALATTLRDLTKRALVERNVEASVPIKTRYRLTPRGEKVVLKLRELQKLLE